MSTTRNDHHHWHQLNLIPRQHSDRLARQTSVWVIFVQALLTGISITLTYFCLLRIRKRWSGTPSQWIILIYTLLLSLISLLGAIFVVCDYQANGFSLDDTGISWEVASAAIWAVSLTVSDTFLIYRVSLIWPLGKWQIALFALPSFAACIISGVIFGFWGLIIAPISSIVDITCGILIAIRLFQFTRRMRAIGAEHSTLWTLLKTGFVETIAISTVFKILAIPFFFWSEIIFQHISVPFTSIGPCLLVLRLHSGTGTDRVEMRTFTQINSSVFQEEEEERRGVVTV